MIRGSVWLIVNLRSCFRYVVRLIGVNLLCLVTIIITGDFVLKVDFDIFFDDLGGLCLVIWSIGLSDFNRGHTVLQIQLSQRFGIIDTIHVFYLSDIDCSLRRLSYLLNTLLISRLF